ncbi:poly(beta-D-mannuronate) lyase [Vibrio maritimus]|uniref:Poly(Beta-D-mannuronate) lyase n=1 Tax=Vibrio maritimus TaxID=990268 RepID=A0A090TRL2_9VIBR|nr:poly(beta-D-mannuronate) lyase [Vibrio maritimus]
MKPLGESDGYQHLWNIGSGRVEGSSLVSWLVNNSYYSLVTSANQGSEVIFARLGANDPDFNLRSEPAMIMRQTGKDHVFASVLETHGYFNEEFEQSVNARGLVESVNIVGDNEIATIIQINMTTGKKYRFAISNLSEDEQQGQHSVEFDGQSFSWKGSFAQV